MSQTIKVSFNVLLSDTSTLTGWNSFDSGDGLTANTEISADLLDDTGASTGYGLWTVDAFDTAAIQRLNVTPVDVWGWERDVWIRMWQTSLSGDYLSITGLTPGTAYTLKISGEGFGATRDTEFSATGATNNPQTYDNTGETGTPSEQITLTGTVTANTTIDITLGVLDSFALINAFELTLTPDTELVASAGNVAITGGSATLLAVSESEGANSWFNSEWWRDPTFGSTWWLSSSEFVLTCEAGTVVVTGGNATLTSPADNITLVVEAGTVIITGGDAKLSVPLVAEAGTITITGGSATLEIEYTSEEFLISKSGTFDGLGIVYGSDVAYNSSTDVGYTILSRVDVDTIELDGIFGEAPQPYQILKYVGEATKKAMIEVEFDGTNWRVVSKTNLSL